MSQVHANQLRGYRKRANLTQSELAALLGCQHGTKVSRYERCVREPNLRTVFAYQAVFRQSGDELFPDIFSEVEKAVIERAQVLERRIRAEQEDSRKVQHKISFLGDVISQQPVSERSNIWENPRNQRFYLS